MKYTTEMGSGAIDIFTKINKDCFSHSKFVGGEIHMDTHRQKGAYLYFLE
jgi:hypothetical protein